MYTFVLNCRRARALIVELLLSRESCEVASYVALRYVVK